MAGSGSALPIHRVPTVGNRLETLSHPHKRAAWVPHHQAEVTATSYAML
jgi:hypothetical protein